MEIVNKDGIEYTAEKIAELESKAKLAEQLAAEKAKAEDALNGVVEELKELRVKNREQKPQENNNVDNEAKTRELLLNILNEERSKQSEMNRTEFEERFKSSNPEFQPANDIGGIKWNAFKQTLNRFNLSNVSGSDLEKTYKDALRLMRDTNDDSKNNANSFSPASRGTNQRQVTDNDLLQEEIDLMNSVGWTKEKYLKLKASQPDYVRSLL